MIEITMNMKTAKELPDFRQDLESILANVSDREEFLKVKEEWHDTKTIVDFIAKQLSAFPYSDRGQKQYPILNLDELGPKERILFPSVVMDLSRCGVISYSRPTDDAVVTTRWAEEILAGKNIKIESRSNFEKYRKSVLSNCNLIKKEEGRFKESLRKKWPSNFKVGVKDREIWINDFFLSKPYGAGVNMAFFEHIIQHPDQRLQRENMPIHIKDKVGGKDFRKILNALRFKSEILKAFVPKRGKSSLLFRKSVATKQLVKDGIKIELLLLELRKAQLRHNPK